MNKKIIALTVLCAIVFSTACKKEFLERTASNQLPAESSITSEGGMRDAINGLYASLRTANLYGRSVPLLGDLLADNTVLHATNSNRYTAENQYTFIATSGTALGIWTDAYSTILAANNIINSSVTSNANVDNFKGEAYALRALMYFELVRFFATPYTVSPDAEGVPIVLTYDIDLKPSRKKVSEVYAQVIADFNQAFMLITQAKNSSYINKYAVKALLARVYQHMGDWTNARTAALDVVTNGGYVLLDTTAFKEYFKTAIPVPAATVKPETIFEVSSDAVNNLGSNALAYFYEQDRGYGDAIATDNVFNLYSATDARRYYIDPTKRRANATTGPLIKAVVKYPNTNNANDKDDTKVIRYADVLLILAEAYYNLNDETNARLRLNEVARKRDPLFAGYASTGTALLDDIINERRKEFAFEGLRFWDLVRLNRVIDRGPQYPASGRTIAVGNTRRLQPIPQTERDANPNISQNAGY
ncbi:MAG TPA: RagB/SusD family nutrient uptake outer membrane protein [Chitinophagaceae bacterium]